MDENKHFADISETRPIKPPKRLFGVIIERLKMERILRSFKKRFSLFLTLLVFSGILAVGAFFVFKYESMESESGYLVSLLFSDTNIILFNFKYFVLAILESMPVISILISCAALALAMFFLRFAVAHCYKISVINKLIKNKKIYGYKN